MKTAQAQNHFTIAKSQTTIANREPAHALKKQYSKGFTLTEASLSMAFVAFLLLAIATLIIYSITLYQKGLTLRNVNNAGLDLIDELTRTISASSNSSPDCSVLNSTTDKSRCNSYKYGLIFHESRTTVKLARSSDPAFVAPSHGFFCTGSYSYVWNTGYVLDTTGTYTSDSGGSLSTARLTLSSSAGSTNNFHLLRMEDSTRSVCASAWNNATGQYPNGNTRTALNRANPSSTISVSDEVYNSRRELLSSISETQLAVYDFSVYYPTYHALTGHAFYSGSFVLGTIAGSVNITSASDTCKDVPDNLNTDFAYCAINKFNFAVRASGASK